MAPSVVFGRQHVLTDDLLRPQRNSGRPSPGYLSRLADSGESEFFSLYQLDLNSPALGDGSFSICRRCIEKETGKEFAVKIMSRRLVDYNSRGDFTTCVLRHGVLLWLSNMQI